MNELNTSVIQLSRAAHTYRNDQIRPVIFLDSRIPALVAQRTETRAQEPLPTSLSFRECLNGSSVRQDVRGEEKKVLTIVAEGKVRRGHWIRVLVNSSRVRSEARPLDLIEQSWKRLDECRTGEGKV